MQKKTNCKEQNHSIRYNYDVHNSKEERALELAIEEHAFKHGLSENEIRYAWDHFLAKQYRGAPNEGEIVAIGCDIRGRLIQMVAMEKPCGILIYHAMTPPTRRVMSELGLAKR